MNTSQQSPILNQPPPSFTEGIPAIMVELRDRFAIAALPACIEWQIKKGHADLKEDGEPYPVPFLPSPEHDQGEEVNPVAVAAYLFADAMIRVRSQPAPVAQSGQTNNS